MALQDRDYIRSGASTAAAEYDAGLRAHMLRVYNYMCAGLVLTGVVAFAFSQYLMTSPETVQMIYGTPLRWVLALAPFAFILAMSFGMNRFSTPALQAMFWGFATLMGLSMSTIFLVYTGESIALAFFSTAAAFAGLSLFGYTTKKDLTGWGSFLIMGVVGLIVASVLNIFLKSSVMGLVISYAAVLIFAGPTAYDTQKLKSLYWQVAGSDMMGKVVIMGALNLYLDFINMFQALLSIMGSRD